MFMLKIFPVLKILPEVPEQYDPQQESHRGPSQVRRVWDEVVLAGVPVVDRHPGVDTRDQEEAEEPEGGELHLPPVEDHVGQVGRYEGVHPATGPGQVDVRVGQGDGEAAGQDTCEVDQHDPPPPVDQLQGETQ